MNLFPYPRSLKRHAGFFIWPASASLRVTTTSLDKASVDFAVGQLQSALKPLGVKLKTNARATKNSNAVLRVIETPTVPEQPGGYGLEISKAGITVNCGCVEGLRYAVATLRQLLREYGRRLPCLTICDWPDFPHRGVMLDVSRGRVPRLETLMELAGHLADFKINELQLYTEHTFAYRRYEPVWREWSPLTGSEILQLDAHCRKLGIELVPNQNSFGHMREWLAYPPLKKLAETPEPWADLDGSVLRRPSTLAPNHPGTIPFLRRLYDELLPHFTSTRFNVGCDETWDLGRGQSRKLCARIGKGRVYLNFLKKIHREVRARGKQMMFWGDIILHYPELVKDLPPNVIALNWGYEAAHPFDKECAIFAKSKIPFYVCPGTSSWMTLIGRHDNALANLARAAHAGRKHGAIGFLVTDWGDGGHPQPLAVSYLPFLAGAAMSWCEKTFDEKLLLRALNRDIFHDDSGKAGAVALGLGLAHRKLKYTTANATPLGATIAAPPPEMRELFCREGLKYFARVERRNIIAAMRAIEMQRRKLRASKPRDASGKILVRELDLAARMAAQSCEFMLWQQDIAAGYSASARQSARRNVKALTLIQRDFDAIWPIRNKGKALRHWPFLDWRIRDYERSISFVSPKQRGREQSAINPAA